MLPADGFLKGLAALVTGGLAAILLVQATSNRRAQLWLSAFLLLIATNQAAEAVRTLPVDPVTAQRLFRVASIAAALDPVALMLFAGALPGGERSTGSAVAWPTAAVGACLAAYAGWVLPEPDHRGPFPPVLAGWLVSSLAFAFALSVFTLVVYAIILRWALQRVALDRGEVPWRPLTVGLAVVTIPCLFRALDFAALLALRPRWTWATESPTYLAIHLAMEIILVGLLSVAVGLVARRHWRTSARAAVVAGSVAGLALLLLVLPRVALFVEALGASSSVDLAALGRSGAALRWLAFSVALSIVACRDDGLRMTRAARRRTARALVGLGVLVAAGVAFAILGALSGPHAQDIPLVVWIGLVAAVVLSQGSRSFIDAAVAQVYGLSEERAPSSVAEPLLVGRLISDRYRVVGLIGRGSSGRVFLAHDERMRRAVVIKEVPDVGPTAIEEARLAGRISHGNVAAVHDVVLGNDHTLMILEHVGGGTLAERVARCGPFSHDEGSRVIAGILDGLAAVHAAGVVHRDLSPANVLLAADGTPKIADFGIATARGTRGFDAVAAAGTPGHVAPEQARGETPSAASDVFSVGVLAREIIRAPLPPALHSVVERATKPSPTARFQDARAMREAWERATLLQSQ